MRRWIVPLTLTASVFSAAPGAAFDATRYGSPTYNTPNVDKLVVQSLNGLNVPYARPFAGARTRTLLEKLDDLPVNVRDLPGFDPTGRADSTGAIQAAINALPATGGIVVVPCGSKIKISATLQVHNGTASAYTTRNGTIFEGDCGTPASWSFSGALPAASVPTQSVQFLWYGPADQPMMQVNGGDGWGVNNVVFDCRNIASDGLKYISASTGDSKRIAGLNCKKFAINGNTVPGISVGGQTYKADSLRNHFTQVYALLADGGRCIGMDGDRTATGSASTDTDFNLFENVQCQDKATTGSTPGAVYFGVSDSNIVRNLQCTLANSLSSCIEYDATNQHNPILPGSNLVDFVDWGGIVTNPVKVTETPGKPLQAFNFITNVLHVNGGDTRVRLHPKIFMTDGSVSVTNETVQARRNWMLTDGSLAANLYQESGVWKYYGNGPGLLWDYHSSGGYFSMNVANVNGNGRGFPATGIMPEILRIYASGFHEYLTDISVRTIRTTVYTVAGLPACSFGAEGQRAAVSDASNPGWNQPLVGGGSGHVGARCSVNGSTPTWVAD